MPLDNRGLILSDIGSILGGDAGRVKPHGGP